MTSYYGVPSALDPHDIRISQSDLASFKRDRRIWFLTTYLGLRPVQESPVSPLVLGTLVHTALEARYRNDADLLAAYAAACATAEADYREAATFFPDKDWSKQAELGRIMLEGYEEWLAAENIDSDIRTIAVEKILEAPTYYHASLVTLIGKADHIVQNLLTNEVLVYDWKTTASFATTLDHARKTEQLPFYMCLQQVLEPEQRVSGAAFTLLRKVKRTGTAKPPFYHREIVRYDPHALNARKAGIDGVISDYVRVLLQLHEGVAEPLRVCYPNPGVLSFSHTYDPIIEIMDNGGNVAGVIAAHYRQTNPLARYNSKIAIPGLSPGSTFLEDGVA